MDGDDHCSGTPEVLYGGRWQRETSKGLDSRAAMVVCRELGCGNVIDLTFRRDFNRRDEEEPLISIKCEGNESAVSQCRQQLTYDYLSFTMVITCQVRVVTYQTQITADLDGLGLTLY